MPVTLAEINAAATERCVALLSVVVERAPWLLRDVPDARPFGDVDAVADAVEAAIRDADAEARLRLLRGHPELAGDEALAGTMTAESRDEQGRLGLTTPTRQARDRLTAVNEAYRDRFGWPYVVALHRIPDLGALLADAERRLRGAPRVEIHLALNEVVSVMRARCRRLIVDDASPVIEARAIAPAHSRE